MLNDTESEDEISEEISEKLELNISIPSSREENVSLKITAFESDSNTPSLCSNAIILNEDVKSNRCHYESDFQRRRQNLPDTRQSEDEKFSFSFEFSGSSRILDETDTSKNSKQENNDIHDIIIASATISCEEEKLHDLNIYGSEMDMLLDKRSNNIVNDVIMYESSHDSDKANIHKECLWDDLSPVPSLILTENLENSWSSDGHAKDRSFSEVSLSIPKVSKISTDADESVHQLVQSFSLQEETSFDVGVHEKQENLSLRQPYPISELFDKPNSSFKSSRSAHNMIVSYERSASSSLQHSNTHSLSTPQNPSLSPDHESSAGKNSLSSLQGPVSLQFSAHGPRYRLHSPRHLSHTVDEKVNVTCKNAGSIYSDKWAYMSQNVSNSKISEHKKYNFKSENGTSQKSIYKKENSKDRPYVSEPKSCPVSPRQKRSNQNSKIPLNRSSSYQNTNCLSRCTSIDLTESSVEREILQSTENKKVVCATRKKILSRSTNQKENLPVISKEKSDVVSLPKSVSFENEKYLDDHCNISFLNSRNLSERSSVHKKHSKTSSQQNKSQNCSNRKNLNSHLKSSELFDNKYECEEILSVCDTDEDLEEMEDLAKLDGNLLGLSNVQILNLTDDFNLNADVVSQNSKMVNKGMENGNQWCNEIYIENSIESSNVDSPKRQILSIENPKPQNEISILNSKSFSDNRRRIDENTNGSESLLVKQLESNCLENKQFDSEQLESDEEQIKENYLLHDTSPVFDSPTGKLEKQFLSNESKSLNFMQLASLDNSNEKKKSLVTELEQKFEGKATCEDSSLQNKEFDLEQQQGMLRRENSGGFDISDKSEDCECSGICDLVHKAESISFKHRSAISSRSDSFTANSTDEELLEIDVDNSGRDIISGDFSDTSEVILGILNKSPISAITERTEESGHDIDAENAAAAADAASQGIDLDSNLGLRNEPGITYENKENLAFGINNPSDVVGNSWTNPCFPSLPERIPIHLSSQFTDPSLFRGAGYSQIVATSDIAFARKTEIKSSSHKELQKQGQGIVSNNSKLSKQNNPLKRPNLQRMTSKSLHNLAGSPRSRYRQNSFQNKTVSISSENISQRSPRSKCQSPAGDTHRHSRSSTPRLRSHLDRRCVSAFTINEDHYNNGVFSRNQSVSLNRLNRSRSSSMTSITGYRRPDYSQVQSKVRRYIQEMKDKDIRNSTRSLPVTPSKSSKLQKDPTVLDNQKLMLDFAKAANVEEDFPGEFENLKKQFRKKNNDPKSLDQLLKLLILERNSRHNTDKTLTALQLEYENLITKHAAAENLIDQLRFYKDIKINKEYLVKIKGQDESSFTPSRRSSRQTTPPNTPNRYSFTPTMTSFSQFKSSSPIVDAGFPCEPSESYLFQESFYEDTTRDTSVTERGSKLDDITRDTSITDKGIKLTALDEIGNKIIQRSPNALTTEVFKDQDLSSTYRRKSSELTFYNDSGVVDETNDMIENWSIESDSLLKKVKDFAILEASEALKESEKQVIWNHILEKYFSQTSMFPGVSLLCGSSHSPGLKLQELGQAIHLTAKRFGMDLNVPKELFSTGQQYSSDRDRTVHAESLPRNDRDNTAQAEGWIRDDIDRKLQAESRPRDDSDYKIDDENQHGADNARRAESASQPRADNLMKADFVSQGVDNIEKKVDNEFQSGVDKDWISMLSVAQRSLSQDKTLYDDKSSKINQNTSKSCVKPNDAENNSKGIYNTSQDTKEEIDNMAGKKHFEIKSPKKIFPKQTSEIRSRSSSHSAIEFSKENNIDEFDKNYNGIGNKLNSSTINNQSFDTFEPINKKLYKDDFSIVNAGIQEPSGLQNHNENLIKKGSLLESSHSDLKWAAIKKEEENCIENLEDYPYSPIQSNDSMKTVGVIEKVEMWQMSLPSPDLRIQNDFDNSSGSSTPCVVSLPQATLKQKKIISRSQQEKYQNNHVEKESRKPHEQRHSKDILHLDSLDKNKECSPKAKINVENTLQYPCKSGDNSNKVNSKSETVRHEVCSRGSCNATPRLLLHNSNKPRDLDSGCPGSERSTKFSRNASVDNQELHTEHVVKCSVHDSKSIQNYSSFPSQPMSQEKLNSNCTLKMRENSHSESIQNKNEVGGTKSKSLRHNDDIFKSTESHDWCPNSDIVNVAFGSNSAIVRSDLPIHGNGDSIDRNGSPIDINRSPINGNGGSVNEKSNVSKTTQSRHTISEEINTKERDKTILKKRNPKESKYDTKIKSKYTNEMRYVGNPADYDVIYSSSVIDEYHSDASCNSSFTSDTSKTTRLKKDIEIMKIQMKALSAQVFQEKQKNKKYSVFNKTKSLKKDTSLQPLKAFDISSSNYESNDSSDSFSKKVRSQKRKGHEIGIPSTIKKYHSQVHAHENSRSKYLQKEDIKSLKALSTDKTDSECELSRPNSSSSRPNSSSYRQSRPNSSSYRREDLKVHKQQIKSNKVFHENNESEGEILSQINNHNDDVSVSMDISISNLSPYNTINMEKLPCSTPIKHEHMRNVKSKEEMQDIKSDCYNETENSDNHILNERRTKRTLIKASKENEGSLSSVRSREHNDDKRFYPSNKYNPNENNEKRRTKRTLIKASKENEGSLSSVRSREHYDDKRFDPNNKYSPNENNDYLEHDMRLSEDLENQLYAHKINRRKHKFSESKYVQEYVTPLRVSESKDRCQSKNRRDRYTENIEANKETLVGATPPSIAAAASTSIAASTSTLASTAPSAMNREASHPASPSHIVYIQHYNACCSDISIDKRDLIGAENVSNVDCQYFNKTKDVNKSSCSNPKNMTAQSSSQTQCQTNISRKGGKTKRSSKMVSYRELLASLDEATKMADKIRLRSQNLLEDLNMQV